MDARAEGKPLELMPLPLPPDRWVALSSAGPFNVYAQLPEGKGADDVSSELPVLEMDVGGKKTQVILIESFTPTESDVAVFCTPPPEMSMMVERYAGVPIEAKAMPLLAEFMEKLLDEFNGRLAPFGRQISMRLGMDEIRIGPESKVAEVIEVSLDPTPAEVEMLRKAAEAYNTGKMPALVTATS